MPKQSAHKKQIFLVDDETDITSAFAAGLERQFDVKCFSSAQEALLQLEHGAEPDIIFSDLNMPGMDGLTFLSKLREKNTRTQLIITTGYAQKNDAVRAIDLGVFAFLEKPFTVAQIRATIDRAILAAQETTKELALFQNIRNLMKAYSTLNDQYFDRIVLLENNGLISQLPKIVLKDYLAKLSKERHVLQSISDLKDQGSTLLKNLKKAG